MRKQTIDVEVEYEMELDEVQDWIASEADARELNLVMEAVIKRLQRINLESKEKVQDTKRAVFVSVRIERTDKISDLLNYLLSNELEFEAEE